MTATSQGSRLYRSRDDRRVAGVCGGIAQRFGFDPTLVRVAFLVSLLLPGPQVLLYVALWLIIPLEPPVYEAAAWRAGSEW